MLTIKTVPAVPKGSPAVAEVVQMKSAQDPIVRMAGEINMLPDVPAMTKITTSNNGGGAVAQTGYFLNEDVYNATPTNNGSGAASITNTYGDGWTGAGYNRLAFALAPYGGIKCYGFTMQYTNFTTGAELPSGLANANPTWRMANLVGNAQIPKGFVTASGVRNTQYLSGTMTIEGIFYLNALCQFSYGIPVNSSLTLTILTQPLA